MSIQFLAVPVNNYSKLYQNLREIEYGEEYCRFIGSIFLFYCSSVGGWGDAGTFPRPEIGKIGVEIWCYLPELYTFGQVSEIQEIFIKNCEKSQFSIEILIKKSLFENFLESFQNSLHFGSERKGIWRLVAYL